MNFKYILISLILLALSFANTTNAQDSYNEHRGNIYFERSNFNKAVEQYHKVYDTEPLNYRVQRKIAECYKYMGVDSTAARYYESYIKTESFHNNDLYNYYVVLKNMGNYNAAGQILNEYNLIRNKKPQVFNKSIIEPLKKKSRSYDVRLVQASSSNIDFSPTYYKDKIMFVSSRQKTNLLQREYERDQEAYFQIFIADKNPDGQLTNISKFDNKFNTRFHEGPLCYCPADSSIYFTRNNYKGYKQKSSSGLINLKIYHSKFTYNKYFKGFGDKLDSIGINTKLNDTDWRTIHEHPLCSKEYSIGHPSLTPDGQIMYFASDMLGGKGKSDIYYSMKIGPDQWSEPTNISSINTAGDDMFPFIHESGILYFASDGLAGLGGLDIFKVEVNKNTYRNPVNMGAPVNSNADDFGLIVDKGKNTGYFSSNRADGKGKDDLYYIEFISRPKFILAGTLTEMDSNTPLANTIVQLTCNENGLVTTLETNDKGEYSTSVFLPDTYKISCIKPDYSPFSANLVPSELTIVNDTIQYPIQLEFYGIYGKVFIKGTKEVVPGVKLTITNKIIKETLTINTNNKGEFKQVLKKDTDYNIFFDKPDYFIIRDKYSTADKKSGWVNLNEYIDLGIEKIEVGKTIEIPNIYYDLAKYDIRTDAAIELDKVVEFMIDNPTIKIELGSHTDSRGGYKTNQRLSQKRAQSAVNYIVESGIDESRIHAKGYGESVIKNRCKNGVTCSEKEHEENRRTEIKITSFSNTVASKSSSNTGSQL